MQSYYNLDLCHKAMFKKGKYSIRGRNLASGNNHPRTWAEFYQKILKKSSQDKKLANLTTSL